MLKIKGKILGISYWLLVIGLLFYTRFVGLDWGLPYHIHPDERNMANAIQQLKCEIPNFNLQNTNKFQITECFNPHFYAYGQFPLYTAYLIVLVMKFFDGDLGMPINYSEAAISLRIISALASVLTAYVVVKLVKILNKKTTYPLSPITFLIVIFSPYAIQFSHFGTTESLLMFFYSAVIYFSLRLIRAKELSVKDIIILSFLSGLSLASKISSLIFIAIPIATIILKIKEIYLDGKFSFKRLVGALFFSFILTVDFTLLTFFLMLVFSPQNLFNWNDFISALNYERDVALGSSIPFYTRQFTDTIPVWFQVSKVFPYVLGWPIFILGGLGILKWVGWKDRRINLLRLSFLIYFLPSAFIYAKWSRFMTPVLPILTVFSVLLLEKINVIKIVKVIIVILAIAPGIAYLSIYQNPDVRFRASEWIYKNIPENSYILSETANVVDIPIENPKSPLLPPLAGFEGQDKIQNPNYQIISFNFYELDEDPLRPAELGEHLKKADYIFVPSRRIFANHYCEKNLKFQMSNFKSISNFKCQMLKEKYPKINQYYDDLFSGKLGFEKVAEFSSYPKIRLFGKTLVEFPDEKAEETWTVFDHPVIRIYKRIKS